MKLNLNMLLILAASTRIALAEPVCPSTTLSNGIPTPAYENSDGSANGFVCDFGGLEFSNFHSNVPGVEPVSIGISPGFQAGTTNSGLRFSGPFTANAGELQDVYISFTVTALTGLLTDVHIQLDNSFVTGTGSVWYTEQVCLSVTDCAVFADNPSGTLVSDMVLSAPQKSLNISKDLILAGGSSGFSTMSEFSNYYSHTSEVPEPRSIAELLCLGFFGLMAWRVRVR